MTSRAPTSGPVHLLLWLAVGQAKRQQVFEFHPKFAKVSVPRE
jgi:hypothetical protein